MLPARKEYTAMADCAVCGRDYSSNVQRIEPKYSISSAEMQELLQIKRAAYRSGKSRLITVSRDMFDHNMDRNAKLQSSSTSDTDSTKISWTRFFVGVLRATNFTRDEQHGEFDRLNTTANDKTLIRTMNDRSANINDVCWALKNAQRHQIGMNVFLLHIWSFVWLSILPPRAGSDVRASYDLTRAIVEELQSNYWLMKVKFGEINKLLDGVARLEWHDYLWLNEKYLKKDRLFYLEPAAGMRCPACNNTHYTPKNAIRNDIGAERQLYLTVGDMAALSTVKTFSFQYNTVKIGFLSDISNKTARTEVASSMNRNDVERFAQENELGWARGVLRGFNFWTARDELWDRHEGQGTIFRSMPDRNAGIKDLIWLLETSDRHRKSINALFLHKRHVLWVYVRAPTPQMTAVHTRLLTKKINNGLLKGFYSMRKNNLDALNSVLSSRAQVKYFKYPDLSWLGRITEEAHQRKILAMKLFMMRTGVGILVSSAGSWKPNNWDAQYGNFERYAMRTVLNGLPSPPSNPKVPGAEGPTPEVPPEEGPSTAPTPQPTPEVPEAESPPFEAPTLQFDESGAPVMPSCLPACRDNAVVAGFDCDQCVFPVQPPLMHGGGQGTNAVGGNPRVNLLG